jgi:hypothetical protein
MEDDMEVTHPVTINLHHIEPDLTREYVSG